MIASPASALNTETHQILNEEALGPWRTGAFDQFFRNKFGFTPGIRQRFGDKTVIEWIRAGGNDEDDADQCRPMRHFHDPIYPASAWGDAGLELVQGYLLHELAARACVGYSFQSSARWIQNPNQRPGGQWSWTDARASFAETMTSRDPVAREAAWGRTFKALGHVMHLVTDVSVPEHVRNDTHPEEYAIRTITGNFLGGAGSYEYWVSDAHSVRGQHDAFIATYLRPAIPVSPEIFRQPTGDDSAPAPISRLIDTDQYDGTNPEVTRFNNAIGLAEYANANFFSLHTANPPRGWRSYVYPKRNGLRRVQLIHPVTGESHLRA